MEKREQIKQLIKESKISFTSLKKSLNTTRTIVVNWSNGKGKLEDNEVLDAIIRSLEKSLSAARSLRNEGIE